ncbi:TPA: hypothetical protein N0F65_004072 [Lagenidium giganteum]|uniref:Uncharacterized protein n=1 Tax=Lagenidium giganteum TaxID=4803 RepID=A0AAV2Z1F6_9STRA|nr:TPA: hypothetical protein N0F65_004072 [Lagenidium giganteum]
MKRRLADVTNDPAHAEGAENAPADAGVTSTLLSDRMQQLIAANIAKEMLHGLRQHSAGQRFGSVPFDAAERGRVAGFLEQKLAKENLTRRPGPRGTRLTYIESCKAIELANRAFGFNGWSCRIIECKEEYREKKGDKWSLGYSTLVRIELKDGTSHEDVGFGQADGQRDLGASIEQAKKASISDARKRALRLFGEQLGNSCYDREVRLVCWCWCVGERARGSPVVFFCGFVPTCCLFRQHIRDVLANKPPAAAVALLPPPNPVPQAVPSTSIGTTSTTSTSTTSYGTRSPPTAGSRTPPQTSHTTHSAPPAQQHSAAPSNPMQQAQPSNAAAVAARISVMHAEQQRQPQMAARVQAPATTKGQQTYNNTHAKQPYQSHAMPATMMTNAPPPTRQGHAHGMTYTPTPVKPEPPSRAAQYEMDDLSLSQFEFDPNDDQREPKRIRS